MRGSEERRWQSDYAPTCSTFVEFFADVSKKGISRESANSCTQRVTRAQRNKAQKQAQAHLGSGVVDHFFGGQIALVAYKHLVDFIAGQGVSVVGRGGSRRGRAPGWGGRAAKQHLAYLSISDIHCFTLLNDSATER